MSNSFTFNNINSKAMNIEAIRAPRNIVPARKTEIVEIPFRSTAYVIPDDSYSLETINVDCFLDLSEKSIFQVGREWASWLQTNGFADLIFDDDPTFTYKAFVTSAITVEDLRSPIVTIQFIVSRGNA